MPKSCILYLLSGIFLPSLCFYSFTAAELCLDTNQKEAGSVLLLVPGRILFGWKSLDLLTVFKRGERSFCDVEIIDTSHHSYSTNWFSMFFHLQGFQALLNIVQRSTRITLPLLVGNTHFHFCLVFALVLSPHLRGKGPLWLEIKMPFSHEEIIEIQVAVKMISDLWPVMFVTKSVGNGHHFQTREFIQIDMCKIKNDNLKQQQGP